MQPKKPFRLDRGQIEVLDEAMVEVLRAKSGGERLRMASDMYDRASRMVHCRVREVHPEWTEQQVHAEAVRRLSHGAIDLDKLPKRPT